MTVGTGISRITGFVRTALLASVLGMTGLATREMADSFNLANITPNIVYDMILGGILASLFIPIFVEYLTTKDEEEAWYVANSIFNIMLILLSLVTLALCIASPYVIKAQTFLSHGTRAQMEKNAIFLLRFFIWEVLFYGFCAIYTGILNSYKHFTIPAFAPIANNIVVVATLAIYRYHPNIYVLAIGGTCGVVAMTMIQYPWVRQTGFRYRFILDLKHPAIRKFMRLAVPVFGYVFINQIGLWVVNILATQVRGGISAFQYAYIFFQLPYGIIAVSIITALFPSLSEQAVKSDQEKVRKSVSLGIRTTAFVIIPSSVGYALLSKPIVRLLLEHLNFRTRDTEMLARVLFYFVLGLFFFSIFMLILKVFYSMQDTRTPTIVAAIIIGLNIGLDFLYFYTFKSDVMKVAGLALGNTTAYVIGAILIWEVLRRRLGSLDGKRVAVSLFKTCLASTVMGLVVYGTAKASRALVPASLGEELLEVFLPIITGALTYLAVATILRSEEIGSLKNLLLRFAGRKQSEIEPQGKEPSEKNGILY